MNNIQDILNKIQSSSVNKLKEDALMNIRKRKKVYEYDSQGNLLNVHLSAQSLRNQGIRVNNRKNETLTINKSGNAFSSIKYDCKEKFLSDYRKKTPRIFGRSVIQCDGSGNVIKKWSNMKDASISLGIQTGNILRSIKKGYKVGGFIFVDSE